MMVEEELEAASSVRRGVVRLGQRLRAERPAPSEPPLRLSVLGHLSRHGAMTPGALAELDRLQPQSLTRTLAGLEEDGLISRQADPADRRRALLVLTGAGRDVLRRDMRARDAWLARAMAASLTRTEREVLRLAGDLLEQLAETVLSSGD
jgi:DNA-binding MarR family transcriptional regulator